MKIKFPHYYFLKREPAQALESSEVGVCIFLKIPTSSPFSCLAAGVVLLLQKNPLPTFSDLLLCNSGFSIISCMPLQRITHIK